MSHHTLNPNPVKGTYIAVALGAVALLGVMLWPKKSKAASAGTDTLPGTGTEPSGWDKGGIVSESPANPVDPNTTPAESVKKQTELCKTFDQLAPYAKVAKFNIYYVDTDPVAAKWGPANQKFATDARAIAYSSAVCSFYYWDEFKNQWRPDIVANAHAKSWFKENSSVSG